MLNLSALSYSIVKSHLPEWFLSSCSRLKKTWLTIERDKLQIQFLNNCLDALVLPKHLMDAIPKRQRSATKFGEPQKNAINNAIAQRIESATANERVLSMKMDQLSATDQNICNILITHFTKRDIQDIKEKHNEQLKSLSYIRKAKILQTELEIRPVVNLSTTKFSKSEFETLKYGFNMTWPTRINLKAAKVEI